MKVDGSLASLIQGVSQQPPRTRLPGQCTLQENMSSNPVDGLTRRPPLDYIAELFTSASTAQWYYYALSSTQQYLVAVTPNDLKVFDLDGVEQVVNEEDSAFDYLDGGSLAFTTLSGLTYLANRDITVAMDAATKSYVQTGSIVYLLGGQYGRKYEITIDWSGATISVSWTAPDGGSAAHSLQITTDNIATQLAAALNANGTFTANFSVTRSIDHLYIKKTSAVTTESFKVTVGDGDGGVNMKVCNNTVQDASDLPRYAPQGYVSSITGNGAADEDNWYVVFDCFPDSAGSQPAVGSGFGQEGIWLETVAPDIPYLLDQTTMPVILEYDEGTTEFTVRHGDWAGRQVGDEESNEDPSFVGKTIEDLGYFQGRLGMLSGPALILSRTNHPDDFWRESATTIVDTDPIDVESTANGTSKLFRMVPHNRDLVIFADKAQFILFGRNAITPQNSSLVLTTAFEAELNASPVPAGRNIFFAINYGQFTGIREFYTEGSQDINDSRPITQHVLKYLEGRIDLMASSSNFDVLLAQTDGDDTKLYVYEYIWQDQEKLQSSWSTWIMPNPVAYAFFVESVIYIVSKVGNNYVLEKLDLDIQNDAGLTYQVKLDRRRSVTGVTDTIVIDDTLVYDDLLFVQGEDCPHPGLRVLVDEYDVGTSTVTLKDDMDGGTVIYGQKYMSKFQPTMPFVKDSDGVQVGTGSLVISKFYVNYQQSGGFYARKFSPYREDAGVYFSGRIVGDPETVIGEAPIRDGSFVIPFRDNSKYAELEIYTDTHEPLTVMDLEWAGQYNKKGQRITQGGN